MNRRIALILLSAGLLATACQPPEAEDREELVRSVNVHIVDVEPEDFSSYLRLIGTISTSNDVRVSAEVSGRITEFYKREGGFARKG
jgi:multidrug efflux pump subunit AcrA (membrane-fusion protein)